MKIRTRRRLRLALNHIVHWLCLPLRAAAALLGETR